MREVPLRIQLSTDQIIYGRNYLSPGKEALTCKETMSGAHKELQIVLIPVSQNGKPHNSCGTGYITSEGLVSVVKHNSSLD